MSSNCAGRSLVSLQLEINLVVRILVSVEVRITILIQGCYPEIQILWLMTKAWNCGINLFRYDICVLEGKYIILKNQGKEKKQEVRSLVHVSFLSTIPSSTRQEAGEKWCALAMRLLHHLSTFKCNYQHKVQFHSV